MPYFSPFPPAPVPGSLEFESGSGAVLDHMPVFVAEANSFAAGIQASAAATSLSQDSAATSATIAGNSAFIASSAAATASAAANFKGLWSALSGALNVPASVLHNGQLWHLTANLANVATAQPGISAHWYPVGNIDIASRAPIQPSLDLDFATQRYRVLDGAVGMREIALADILTYAGSGRTYTGQRGNLIAQVGNAPRLTFDPVTGAGIGLSMWSTRTNLLLNSQIDGTPLSTQTVTLTAAEHRISFCGTGTITLSGAATGSVTGAGNYPSRTGLTFSSTAGVVTLTITGSVQFAMLTLGSTDSPFIPTAMSAVTAPADIATITGENFSKWWNKNEGTLVVVSNPAANVSGGIHIGIRDLAGTSYLNILNGTSIPEQRRFDVRSVGVDQASLLFGAKSTGMHRFAVSYSGNAFNACVDGGSVLSDFAGLVPTSVDRISLGCSTNGALQLDGTISRVLYFPRALPSNLQALSAN